MAAPQQRASDSEREATADRLRVAAGDGRLEPEELEERLEAAYAARTVGDLAALTHDLPTVPAAPEPREPVWRAEHVRARLASFLVANLVCIGVWLASGAQSDFWPRWVLLGTGIALAATLVRTALGVQEQDEPVAGPGLLGPRGLRGGARGARRIGGPPGPPGYGPAEPGPPQGPPEPGPPLGPPRARGRRRPRR